MNLCFFICRRLAAYCDGQLSPAENDRIAAHLDHCVFCRGRTEQISEGAYLMRQLPQLEPTDELWNSLARKLSASRSRKPARVALAISRMTVPLQWARRPAAVVAVLLIMATALLLADRYAILPGRHQAELNLAGYIDLLGTVALAEPALKEFPPAPDFTEIRWSEASAAVDFRVIAPASLPLGYRLATVRLYTRGNLRVLQVKYQSERGGLCIFQLPTGSKLSFGERPSEQYKADGVHCRRTTFETCSVYRFELGGTECVLMVRQSDSRIVNDLIKAFYAEYEKTQKQNT